MGNPLDFCTVRRRVKRKYWQSEIQQQSRISDGRRQLDAASERSTQSKSAKTTPSHDIISSSALSVVGRRGEHIWRGEARSLARSGEEMSTFLHRRFLTCIEDEECGVGGGG